MDVYVCSCRLAVLSQDKQGLRYAALLTRQRANEQLGAVSPSSAAAGVAILTKQPVHVRDINTGQALFEAHFMYWLAACIVKLLLAGSI